MIIKIRYKVPCDYWTLPARMTQYTSGSDPIPGAEHHDYIWNDIELEIPEEVIDLFGGKEEGNRQL